MKIDFAGIQIPIGEEMTLKKYKFNAPEFLKGVYDCADKLDALVPIAAREFAEALDDKSEDFYSYEEMFEVLCDLVYARKKMDSIRDTLHSSCSDRVNSLFE